MNPVTLDIEMLPSASAQWANLHPMARARLKAHVFPAVLEAVSKSGVESIPTPCMVSVHLYFNGKSKGGGLDFDDLCILVGKLFLDPLCPDTHYRTKSGIVRHRVGLNLIPDDTLDHIVGMMITRHPLADRNHTVLIFSDPGQRYRDIATAKAEKNSQRQQTRRNEEAARKVASNEVG